MLAVSALVVSVVQMIPGSRVDEGVFFNGLLNPDVTVP
jgi:hypothetical protein